MQKNPSPPSHARGVLLRVVQSGLVDRHAWQSLPRWFEREPPCTTVAKARILNLKQNRKKVPAPKTGLHPQLFGGMDSPARIEFVRIRCAYLSGNTSNRWWVMTSRAGNSIPIRAPAWFPAISRIAISEQSGIRNVFRTPNSDFPARRHISSPG